MKGICDYNGCTGCMACANICPTEAIAIIDSGFSLNTEIDQEKCIDCRACEKICPVNNKRDLLHPIYWRQGWAGDETRKKSSSGGAASALIQAFIISGGYVAACMFEKGEFSFSVTNNLERATKFAGSKYVKSNPDDIYKEIKTLVKRGERVLFVGLPCQSAAVQNYLGDNENLYTADLICHGTPSSTLLTQYLKEHGIEWTNVADIQFRDSGKFGLRVNGMRLTPESIQDNYTKAFLRGMDYTENCYSCRYATLDRVSDITFGDAWGQLSDIIPDGVSLILCQTQRGIKLIQKSSLHLEYVDLQKAVAANNQLRAPSNKPLKRDRFLRDISKGYSIDTAMMVAFPKESIKQIIKIRLIKVRLLKKLAYVVRALFQ